MILQHDPLVDSFAQTQIAVDLIAGTSDRTTTGVVASLTRIVGLKEGSDRAVLRRHDDFFYQKDIERIVGISFCLNNLDHASQVKN